MEFKIDQLAENIMEKLRSMAKTETIIGTAFKLGEYEVVPVIKVGLGFGTGEGAGEADSKGSGGGGGLGGGISVEPIAFLASKEDKLELLQVNKSKALSSLFDNIPSMMDKIGNLKKDKDEKKDKKEEK